MKDIVVTVASSELSLGDEPASMTVSVLNRTAAPERIVLTAVIASFTPLPQPTGAPAGAPAEAAGASAGTAPAGGAGPSIEIAEPLRDVAAGLTVQYSATFTRGKAAPGRYDVKFIAAPSGEATEEYAERAGRLAVSVTKKENRGPTRRFRWWKLIAAVVAMLLVVGGVAFVLTRPGSVTVPNVVNQPRAQAEQTLTAAGLVPAVTTIPGVKPLGVVVSQEPAAGTEVEQDTKVTVVVRTSLKLVNVTALSAEAAQTKLKALGFSKVRLVEQESTEARGTVLKQVPPADTPVALDDQITLTIASPVLVTVPNVIGQHVQIAATVLKLARLSPVVPKTCSLFGCLVRDQRPNPGERVPVGAKVILEVG